MKEFDGMPGPLIVLFTSWAAKCPVADVITALAAAVAALVLTPRPAPECHLAYGRSSTRYELPAPPVVVVNVQLIASSLVLPGMLGELSKSHAFAGPCGVTELEAADDALSPPLLWATTVNV
jgi:hypothetical protein